TVALRLDGAEIKHLRKLSQKTAVLVGLVEETRSFRFHNSAVLLDRGEIVAVHRKVYLPTYGMFDEQRYFARGSEVRAFDSRFGRDDRQGPLLRARSHRRRDSIEGRAPAEDRRAASPRRGHRPDDQRADPHPRTDDSARRKAGSRRAEAGRSAGKASQAVLIP